MALLLELDPVALVRGHRAEVALQQYVNDRPYVASSMLSVALNAAFRSALGGRSRERPELAATPIPLEASLPVVPCRGGATLLRSLFAPLGYELVLKPLPLDACFPEWGDSRYLSMTLRAKCTLQRLLQHLYVLLPVLDDEKHDWVGDAEVEKLLRHAEQWLGAHPQRERIVLRYLKHRRSLAAEALRRLSAGRCSGTGRRKRRRSGLRCEGKVLAALLQLPQLERVVGMDVSVRSLYRPEYDLPQHLVRLRQRGLGAWLIIRNPGTAD